VRIIFSNVPAHRADVHSAGELPPGFDQALASLSRAYPKWTPVPYTPEESVAHQLATIAKLTVDETGAFMSEKGGRVLYED
jgi:hypothetical protein